MSGYSAYRYCQDIWSLLLSAILQPIIKIKEYNVLFVNSAFCQLCRIMISHAKQNTSEFFNNLNVLTNCLIKNPYGKWIWSDFIYIYIYIYTHTHTELSQKFCDILLTYLLYPLIYNKSSQAFKIEAIMFHYLKPHWYQFLSLEAKNTSLKLPPPPLCCWSIPWIGTSNNLRGLSPDYMLGVASIQFSSF